MTPLVNQAVQWTRGLCKEKRERGWAEKIVTLSTLFLFMLKDEVQITPFIVSGIVRSQGVNFSPTALRLEAAVLLLKWPLAWAAFGLQPPDVDPSREGMDRASLGEVSEMTKACGGVFFGGWGWGRQPFLLNKTM